LDFHQCLLRAAAVGEQSQLDAYSLAIALARAGKFAQPVIDSKLPLSDYGYAFHFDATRYARRLRQYALERSVRHIDRRIVDVEVDTETGFIAGLLLEDGSQLEGDLFIDCSGFRALLIEGGLRAEYEDWSRYLPCDRAIALPSSRDPQVPPFTTATAQEAGWTWRIPLQHRTGNGYVYCSSYASDEAAAQTLASVPGMAADQQPNIIRFQAGARREFWTKNCVALGLAGGFIEPLESTSINLVHRALSTLMDFFPDRTFDPRQRAAANRRLMLEQENIRDFIILHYKANGRFGQPFWDDCRAMEIPATLEHKIETYRACGYLEQYEAESFKPESWLTMYNGFGIVPDTYDVRADQLDTARARDAMARMRQGIGQAVGQAMPHAQFVARFCAAPALE
ncbi:MAG TPA: tryptophan halogenase family protein, partial [Sphingomicrobium sp.]